MNQDLKNEHKPSSPPKRDIAETMAHLTLRAQQAALLTLDETVSALWSEVPGEASDVLGQAKP